MGPARRSVLPAACLLLAGAHPVAPTCGACPQPAPLPGPTPPPSLPARQVIATAHALLANGSVMAPVGMHVVAMAARRHSVPFVVLCGIYKLSTLFPHNPCEPGVCQPRINLLPCPRLPARLTSFHGPG